MRGVRGGAAALSAAFLAGASGLAFESLLVSSSGLALGYGSSAAVGLAVWLSAWAWGAWVLGSRVVDRSTSRVRARVALVGLLLALVGPLAVWTVLQAGDSLAGATVALPLAIVAIAATAFLQGGFLPLLAHQRDSVAGLFGANLFGSLLGAYLIADVSVGALGRMSSAWIAAGTALVAGAIAVASITKDASEPSSDSASAARALVARPLELRAACWIIGLTAAWMSAGEWVALRLGVLWLGGMQNALNAVLCASLLALALGAAIVPRVLPRGTRGVVVLIAACAFASLWPFVAAPLLRSSSSASYFVRALILCGPALLPFGAIVPVVHAATGGASDSGERLGRLLLHESWGALLGIPLVHFLVVPHFGLWAAIATGLAFALLSLVPLAAQRNLRRDVFVAASAVLAACALCGYETQRPNLARASPPLSNPALSVLSLRDDRDFTVAVVDDGILGERTLLTDGFRAAGTGRDYRYMEALGHLPLLLHPAPKRVAVLALGTGTTLGAVAQHLEVARIDVLEISVAVVEAAPYFVEKNHGALSEGLPGLFDEHDDRARVVVMLGDGRATLARARATYDVITMEPLLPDSPFAVYLYTREFYATARRALKPGGIVCQWVPPHALEPRTFDAVLDAFASSFEWSGAWLSGTQVLLIGSERAPELSPARFTSVAGPLHDALSGLGLSNAGDVAARWCGSLEKIAGTTRSLRDADPWIVFSPRRAGADLLTDLPRNLERLFDLPHDLPASWMRELDAAAAQRIEGVRALRRARAAQAWVEAELRGVPGPASAASDLEGWLGRARADLFGDPELVRFDDEMAFLDDVRRGVSGLASAKGLHDATQALDALLAAKEKRPERGDVDLYVAAALERTGDEVHAKKALAQALQRCPRIALTSEGARARSLGLSDAAWARAIARAIEWSAMPLQ